MPHALFVHSYLAKNKLRNDTIEEKRRMRRLHLVECVVTLTIAALVNVAILITAAKALCPSFGCANPPVVDINSLTVNEAAGVMGVVYGTLAGTIFAITLLFSGIASLTTGTLAGQAIMEGLLGTKVNVYVRRIVTRFINVIPTFTAISLGLQPLSLLVYSQVVLSLMIPLPMVPLLYYTSKKKVMGEFVNRRATTIVALIFAGTIVALNAHLLLTL
jgi:manganese transport protein